MARPSLPLATVSFELQNSVSPIALGSPELAATACAGITPHTLYSFMLAEDLATGVVPGRLPSNLMHYVTKRCEHKIWYIQAWFLIYRIICSETRCVLSAPWLGKRVHACPSLCIKSHHLLSFSGLVNAPCPHRFWHWCAWMQKSQGTESPVLRHLDGPKIPFNGPYFSL